MLTRNAKRGDLVWNRQGKHQAYRLIGNPLAIGGCLGKMCILLPVDEWLLEVASSHKVKTDHKEVFGCRTKNLFVIRVGISLLGKFQLVFKDSPSNFINLLDADECSLIHCVHQQLSISHPNYSWVEGLLTAKEIIRRLLVQHPLCDRCHTATTQGIYWGFFPSNQRLPEGCQLVSGPMWLRSKLSAGMTCQMTSHRAKLSTSFPLSWSMASNHSWAISGFSLD